MARSFFLLALFALAVSSVLVLLHVSMLRRTDLPAFSSVARHFGRYVVQSDSSAGDSSVCARRLANATARLSGAVEFLPLKDPSLAGSAMEGRRTWFMSSLNDSFAPDDVAEHLQFPSEASRGRLLCLRGGSRSDGASNSYALAWPDALPRGAVLLEGLTFVSDTYYDYENLWHGLAASLPFVGWHKWRGCVKPARWVLFHWGEVRNGVGMWVRTLLEVTLGRAVEVELLDRGDRPTCLEEAVVFRRNEGSIRVPRRRELYDMMRCKARSYCNVSREEGGDGAVLRMTMLLRTGRRAFRNESATIDVFRKECAKVTGCRSEVMKFDNLTFCEQVRAMSNTDLLISQHGAQMTNLIFMDRNSSVMEFFPSGWKEFAGPGQYVFHWLSTWSGMRHQGAYWESFHGGEGGEGRECPFAAMDNRCFIYYKDRQIGLNESYFAAWTRRVLQQVKDYKLAEMGRRRRSEEQCACDSVITDS